MTTVCDTAHRLAGTAFRLPLIVAVIVAVLVLGPIRATAQLGATAEPDFKVDATLIAPTTAVRAGVPFVVGLRQVIAPHWHTYWKNPGDSGEPTRLTWTLPEGFKASEIAWPIPEAMPVGPLTNYGYSDQVLLPVTITPPKDFAGPSITLSAKAEWLVCEKVCVPEEKVVSLTLPVIGGPSAGADAAAPPSQFAALFSATARAQPIDIGWAATVTRSGGRVKLDVSTRDLDRSAIVAAQFFPAAWGAIEHAPPQVLAWREGGFTLDMQAAEAAPPARGPLEGVLILTERLAGDARVRNGFSITAAETGAVPGGDGTAGKANTTSSSGPVQNLTGGIGLWQAVLFAFLGGIILNLMPCVLPILSIKVMSIATHAHSGSSSFGLERWHGGLAYLAGVAASFAALAVFIVAVRGAGEAMGWGFQFQSPAFVLGLAALFLAMALSMSGVFDVGGSIVGAGQGLARREGLAGSFFTGVLATVAATPCTAPFMGAAIGYAMTRPAAELVLVLQALGLGFAAPVLALTASSSVARLMPKPGAWMETLKQALAFPLYATVAWLVWVLSLQLGSDGVLAAAFVLIAVAFASWIVGQHGISLVVRSGVASAAIIVALFAVWPQLQATGSGQGNSAVAQSGGAPSKSQVAAELFSADRFSTERVKDLRASGQAVFVNLTAAWCISCKVNERLALDTNGFRAALKQYNIAYLKGDWTSRDDAITKVLASYGRAGVPLYLLYPADPAAPAIMLPQLLTESIVVGYLASLTDPSRRPVSD